MGGQERAAVVVRGSFGKDHLSWQIRCNSSEAEALSWSRRPLHLAIQVAVSVSKKIKTNPSGCQFISYWKLIACINVVTGEGFELQGRKSVDVWRCC